MFEPKQQENPKGPGASSQEPVGDMFSGTDPLKRAGRPSPFVAKNEVSQPGPVSPPVSQMPIMTEHEGASSRFGGKGVLVFIAVIVVVGVAVGALAFFLTRKSNKGPTFDVNQFVNANESSGVQETTNLNSSFEPLNSNGMSDELTNVNIEPALLNQEPFVPLTRNVNRELLNVNIPLPAPLDRDGDGLTLEQEGVLGTSDNLSDTDTDGLSDWDEVKVYQSDPLNPDTDGDGYADGSEVKKGFSPIINGQ